MKESRKPKFLASQQKEITDLTGILPSLCWGHGHSPVFKDKCYATLAVGWGPLIQLLVLNDVLETESMFFEDGFFILQPPDENAAKTAAQLKADEQKARDELFQS